MTMPYTEWVAQRRCTRKVAHRSRSHAWIAIWSLILRDRADVGELTPYACDLCDRWHVGHVGGGGA